MNEIELLGKKELAEGFAEILRMHDISAVSVAVLGSFVHVECRGATSCRRAAEVLSRGGVFKIRREPYRVLHATTYRDGAPVRIWRHRVILQNAQP